ncbi:MAG: mRNA surveillance protein pelota, partial [Methanobacteriota archaeon]
CHLTPESLDDLWHLEHLISPRDLVFATTMRSVESATDKLRPEKAEKRPVRLGIRVERVAFHPYANRLRITGTIESGTDVGSYHTVNVEINMDISVIKTWNRRNFERIDRAVKASVVGAIHVLTIEEGEATLFRIRQFGIEQVAELVKGSGKGEGAGGRAAFFEEVRSWLGTITGPIVVAGPGFVKDEFVRQIKSAGDQVADRIAVLETRRSGRGAVQEVIGAGVLERLSGDLQLAREVRCMDDLLARIGSGGPVAYGRAEVESAVNYGAVQQMLVADDQLRNPEVEALTERADRMGATIVVFSTEFDPGIQLSALGGIAALLRFPIA